MLLEYWKCAVVLIICFFSIGFMLAAYFDDKYRRKYMKLYRKLLGNSNQRIDLIYQTYEECRSDAQKIFNDKLDEMEKRLKGVK